MKRSFWLFMVCTCSFISADAQTIYRLKYKSPAPSDSATYDAFFSLSSNGTGIVRVRSTANKSIAEMEFIEEFARDSSGMTDTSMLIYPGSNPVVVSNKNVKFFPVTYWFKLNAENYPEPWAVTEASSVSAPANSNLLAAEFISNKDMSKIKDLVKLFFADTSTYYKNIFGPGSKGIALTPEERKSTRMFLLVVASTKDPHLQPEARMDANKIIQLFSDIAGPYGMGIRLFIDTVYGDKYNKASVEAMLKRLNPTRKKDIVVFYYTGHGFTDRKYPNKEFPFLDLRDPTKTLYLEDLKTERLNIQDIFDTIVSKGARLNIVLSEACNDTVVVNRVQGQKLPDSKGLTKINTDNLRALFMSKDSVSLLMTAASREERSIFTPSFNSYFTNFFTQSLRTYLGPDKGNANWFRVLSDTHTLTRLQAGRVPCPAGFPCPDGKMLRQTPKIYMPPSRRRL